MQITKPTKTEVMRELKDYIFITFGLISYAMGWAAFLIPYQITTGGTTGIGAIIYYATGFPIQWSYFIINAVLMTFAIKILGPKFSIKTTFAIFGLTFFLWFFQMLVNGPDGVPPQILGPGQDFMACLIGAAMCGVGLGVVFNCNGSTGGTDIIAMILKKYTKLNIGGALFLVDLGIVIASCFVFDAQTGLCSLCGLLAKSLVVDNVIESINLCKYFTIICNDPEPICDFITNELHRSATIYKAEGAYEHNQKTIIITIMKRSQAVELRNYIRIHQPTAFIAITNSSEIIGKGFRGFN